MNSRLSKDYDSFCQLQAQKLFESKYEYVEPTYFWNNGSRHEDLLGDILRQLNQTGAQLIILEAAAGYGKTCTSYELIHRMSMLDHRYAPIFTELSKNRKAALFRYVLLDEIDKKFTALSSQLVISEIQNGNVPLIIDGFDELISRSNKNMSNGQVIQEDDSQTMLDTIADLFGQGTKTKVILTSRKSAIFTGDIFEEWVKEKLEGCTITRISIEEPTIKDWLGYEKTNFLEKQRIPFASIINPILLAFMKSMPLWEFKEKCANVEDVIKYYFNALLEREKERQALMLSVEEQYKIMQDLARDFIEFDIDSEEFSFIRDLFIEIIHDSFKEYKDRYLLTEEKPTEEEFATKLAGHALLNRVSPVKNYIGFINDFIYGIFIGDIINDSANLPQNIDSKYIDIACTAYASRSENKRDELYRKISPFIGKFNYEQRLDVELKLVSTIKQDYIDHYISNRTFNADIYFDGKYKFNRCTFRNCTFNECAVVTSAFSECIFYNCRFYNMVVLRDTDFNCKLIFSGNCIGHEQFAQESSFEEKIINDDNYEKCILRKYWCSGGRYSKGRLPEAYILRNMNPEDRQGYEIALENLKKEDFIYKEGHYWYLNKEKIKEIKDVLEISNDK